MNTTFRPGIVALTVAALAVSAAAQEDYKVHFEAGRTAMAAREYEKAVAAFSEVIRINADVPGAYLNRALAYARLNKKDEAIADYTRCIEKCRDSAPFRAMKATALNNRGDIHWQRKNLDLALADAEAALATDPALAHAYRLRACVRYDQGDYDRALADYEKAKSLKADIAPMTITREGAATNALRFSQDPKALVEGARAAIERAKRVRATLFSKTPDRDAAIAALDRATQLEPGNAEAWCLRGQAEEIDTGGMRIGPQEKAVPFYEKAIAADPRHGEAYLRRGLIRLKTIGGGDTARQQGLADLEKAIELGEKSVEAFSERGKSRVQAKDHAGAIADFTEALRLGGDPVEIGAARARAREGKGDWAGAIEDYTRVIGVKPTDGAYARRGDAFAALKNWPKAQADYDKAIALDPEDPDHLLGRAKMYRLQGVKAKASADYAAAHKLDPTIPTVTADLANAAVAEKTRFDVSRTLRRIANASARVVEAQAELDKSRRKKDKAEARLRRLLTGDTRTEEQKLAEIEKDIADGVADEEDYLDRARVYGSQKKLDLAIADCTKAIALKADYAPAYNWRGICHEAQKNLDRAFADYDKAVALDSNKAEYVRNRGDIWFARADFAAAWKDYDKAVTLDPKDARNYFQRGNASFMRKNYDAAIADYDRALELKPDFKAAGENRTIARARKDAR